MSPPIPCRRRLKTLSDARRFLADLINQLNRNEIDEGKARSLGYLLQILSKVIEGDALEARVTALEKQIGEKGERRPWAA
ncbi:MAG: hypothetical protein WCZ16_13290 [Desulfosarcinaceae bacterium]